VNDVLPCLKSASWDPGSSVAIPFPAPDDADRSQLPQIALCRDRPDALVFIQVSDLRGTNPGSVSDRAMDNLEAWMPEAADDFPLDMPNCEPMRVLQYGGLFAAEKLLDGRWLEHLRQELGFRALLVGAPRRAVLMVTEAPADEDHPHFFAFGAIVSGQYRRAESPVISPLVFIVEPPGAIVGAYSAGDIVEPENPSEWDRTLPHRVQVRTPIPPEMESAPSATLLGLVVGIGVVGIVATLVLGASRSVAPEPPIPAHIQRAAVAAADGHMDEIMAPIAESQKIEVGVLLVEGGALHLRPGPGSAEARRLALLTELLEQVKNPPNGFTGELHIYGVESDEMFDALVKVASEQDPSRTWSIAVHVD